MGFDAESKLTRTSRRHLRQPTQPLCSSVVEAAPQHLRRPTSCTNSARQVSPSRPDPTRQRVLPLCEIKQELLPSPSLEVVPPVHGFDCANTPPCKKRWCQTRCGRASVSVNRLTLVSWTRTSRAVYLARMSSFSLQSLDHLSAAFPHASSSSLASRPSLARKRYHSRKRHAPLASRNTTPHSSTITKQTRLQQQTNTPAATNKHACSNK